MAILDSYRFFCRHPIIMVACLVIAGLAAGDMATGANPPPAETSWTSSDGCFRISLPASWQVPVEKVRDDPWSTTGMSLLQLVRADGRGELTVYVLPDTLFNTDRHVLRSYAARKFGEAGLEMSPLEYWVIGNRGVALAEGRRPRLGLENVVDLGVTHVDGRPLLFLFTSTGPDLMAVSMEAKIAMGTIVIDDDAFERRPAIQLEAPPPPAAQAGVAEATAAATAGHYTRTREIPGAGVILEVPTDFLESLMQPGFISNDLNTSVYAVHMPLPMNLMRPSLSADTLLRQHGELRGVEDLEVDGRKAALALVVYQSDAGPFYEYLLLTGHGEESLILHGRFVESPPVMGKTAMRGILLSMVWDPEVGPNSLDDLPFTFSTGSRLRVASRAHGRVVLTLPGGSVPVSDSETFLLIGREPNADSGLEPTTIARECAGRSPFLKEFEVMSTGVITTDAGPGCEMVGTARDKHGNERDFYLAVVVNGPYVYTLQGLQELYAIDDVRKDFSKVAASLRVREP